MIKTIAIVLTACGIETIRLAQLLIYRLIRLQQHLPPAVLKLDKFCLARTNIDFSVATTPTACGIETYSGCVLGRRHCSSCNNTYRLRY